MALILYTQIEVDEMIAMRKRFIEDAWQKRKTAEWGADGESCTLNATAEDGSEEFEFEIWRETHNMDTFSFTLRGRRKPRDFQNLARYDIQDSEHKNPPWFVPDVVFSGVAHKHIYSHKANKENDKWDFCAAPLIDFSGNGTPQTVLTRLQTRFLKDMSLRFLESDTASSLFRSMDQ